MSKTILQTTTLSIQSNRFSKVLPNKAAIPDSSRAGKKPQFQALIIPE
jgi:hypothetical protein